MNKITAKELQNKLESGEKLSIIDVREDDEVAQGIIPGARHIPLGQLPERMGEINKKENHFMVCRSGGRSGKACSILTENGFTVTNMKGGMIAWKGSKK